MTAVNPLNVFKGKSSVVDYFNPDLHPPLPLVELPEKLNPFSKDNVRIYAKMLTALPAQNVKALPALNMLLNKPDAANKSIVEASSGSTALSLGMISRVLWGNEDVTAYVTNKKHPDHLRVLRFFGLKVALYGGLAQQEPVDPRGIMSRLRKLAKINPKVCYPGQYDNEHNWKAHWQWTGAQIWKQLPEINVLSTTVGTGGCITGTGLYLKTQKPTVKVVGVFNVFGDPTPGPRHFPCFESCSFPWRDTIDTFEHVASVDSFELSMLLSREGIIAGPSSGEALKGLFSYLQKQKDTGDLNSLADPLTSEISCVFICCDLPYPYMDGYFQKLTADKFPPIHNEILLSCDQDKYDERWELLPKQAISMFTGKNRVKKVSSLCSGQFCQGKAFCTARASSKASILDLRQTIDFHSGHLRGTQNAPLKGLTADTGDIFGDSNSIYKYWSNLTSQFERNAPLVARKSNSLLVICYDGEISRLAVSLLRAKGYSAFSVFGGYSSLSSFVEDR